MSNHGSYMKNRDKFQDTLNRYFVPLYDCYTIYNEKANIY